MELVVRVADDEAGDQTRSLMNWLQEDGFATVTPVERPVSAGELGGVLEALQILTEPDGIAVAAFTAVATWLGTRKPGVRVKIRQGDKELEIESGRAKDIDRVARLLAEHFDQSENARSNEEK